MNAKKKATKPKPEMLSSLIKRLQKDLKQFGDLPVNTFTSDGEGETENIHICYYWDDKSNKPLAITLCDSSWADAFSE